MLSGEKLKFDRVRFEQGIRLKKEKLKQVKEQFQKRVIGLGVLAIIFLIPILAYRNGYITVPAIIIDISELFFVSIFSLLMASLFVRLTVDRVFHFFEGEFEAEQNIIFAKMYSWFIYAIAIGVILWKVGIAQENITLFLGLMTTGVAFALRDVILSFVVWFMVLQKRPFRIGDVIEIDNKMGVVTRIGTFFITIESVNDPKETIKVPNSLILQKTVLNMGRDRMYREIRIELLRIPRDIDARIKKINSFINPKLMEGESVKIQIDADGWHWYLKVKMIIKPENEAEKSEILKAIYFLAKDIIKTKKE